jgi:hypothetical protein
MVTRIVTLLPPLPPGEGAFGPNSRFCLFTPPRGAEQKLDSSGPVELQKESPDQEDTHLAAGDVLRRTEVVSAAA